MSEDIKTKSKAQPWVPVGHPDFKWTSGADVQATWHRYTGWTPPSAGRKPAYVENREPEWAKVRRVK